MRITAELTVRRTEPRGVFVPSLQITGETTPEDDERLQSLLIGLTKVLRSTADQIEMVTTDEAEIDELLR